MVKTQKLKLKDIINLLNAKVVTNNFDAERFVNKGFSSDLMSDVLTNEMDESILITGLANVQAIRTAEMADIDYILFVRDKEIPSHMVQLAKESGISLLRTRHTMFWVCGVLYKAGLVPVY